MMALHCRFSTSMFDDRSIGAGGTTLFRDANPVVSEEEWRETFSHRITFSRFENLLMDIEEVIGTHASHPLFVFPSSHTSRLPDFL